MTTCIGRWVARINIGAEDDATISFVFLGRNNLPFSYQLDIKPT